VAREAVQESNGRQTPAVHGLMLEDFAYVPGPSSEARNADRSSEPVTDDAVEIEVWRAVQRIDTPASYQEYLRQYPKGRFAGLAALKIPTAQPAEAADRTVAEKQKETPVVKSYQIGSVDVSHFAGLKVGDTIDRAIQLFGKAQLDHYFGPTHGGNFYRGIKVEDFALQINSIFVDDWAADFAVKHGGEDAMVGLLNKPLKDAIALLGPPAESNDDVFVWKSAGGAATVTARFSSANKCEGMRVQWK
jgi:hypothetical protein